jgi:arylsulfatase A-like enzyme
MTSSVDRRTVLRGLGAAGLGAAALPALPRPSAAAAKSTPNVILISIDDLGWDELGCYGNTFNETPTIDALARQGMRFTQAYAAGPVCSPSRAGLMTGLYPARTGITDFLRGEPAASYRYLSTDFVTIPEALRPLGYASGLIGKWHLTEDYSGEYEDRPGNPFAHGFDEVIASEQLYIADGDYFHPYFFMPDLPARSEGEYLTDRLTQEAVDFIARHAETPFFLHLSNYAVHTVLSAKPDLVAKYEAKPGADAPPNRPILAAMLDSIDQQVAAVVQTLHEQGLAEDTLLLVMSDNGGPFDDANDPLRGIKGELYEGGIRVPLIASWPGRIRPGSISRTPVNSIDILPTALDLAGGDVADGQFDGVSLLPVLADSDLDRDELYWIYPHVFGATALPQAAVRSGRHKLVEYLRDGRAELYDVHDDPDETNDIATTNPMTAARLKQALDTHVAETAVLAPAPTADTYQVVELDESFDADADSFDMLTVEGATPAEVSMSEGRLHVRSDALVHHVFRSSVSPSRDTAALVLDPGAFAGTPGQDTVFVGLIKDERNYVMLRYHNGLKRVGWDLRVDGRLITAGQEPLNRLDGTVDLTVPGARYALVLRGSSGTAYVDQGKGWEFLFSYDTAEVIDIRDAAVRAEYRYGFGVRLTSGTISIDGIDARRTP